MKNLRLYASLLLISLPILAFADDSMMLTMPSARMAGMGGYYSTLTDDLSSIFANPAGFAGIEHEFSAAELSFTLNGPVSEITTALVAYLSAQTAHLDLSAMTGAATLYAQALLGGPIAVGWVGKGFGLGLFNKTSLTASGDGTTLTATIHENLIASLGYALRINAEPLTIDFGLQLKGFLRASFPQSIPQDQAEAFLGVDFFSAPGFIFSQGMGIDLGIKLELYESLSLGIVCHDVFTPMISNSYTSMSAMFAGEDPSAGIAEVLPRTLTAGLAWKPHFAAFDHIFSRWIIMAEYRDFLDLISTNPRNPLLNIAAGTEIGLLDILSIRAGFADMLPQFGFGIDFSIFKLDFALSGIELGMEPAENSVFSANVSFLFRY